MKFLSYIIYTTIITLYFTTFSDSLEKQVNNKRSRTTYTESNKIDWDDVNKKLEYKANILEKTIPEVKRELTKIKELLIDKSKKVKEEKKLERSVYLSNSALGVGFIANSADVIIRNLQGRNLLEEKSRLRVSMAIIASGSLKDRLKKVVDLLNTGDDTSDINHTILSKVINDIHEVTKDIENPLLRYE